MARIDSIFKSETKKAAPHPKRITQWIHYTKLCDNEAQYCNETSKEEIEALADLIEADGEVLQDLLVKKTDTDEYKIIAGHKRRRACRLLVEERGKEEFALVPCVVQNISDVRAEFQLYSSNGHHEKTEYEKMHELERMKHLLENYPEEFPQISAGRMVEKLAKLLKMKKTTVGEYLTISKNLGEKGMEKFRSGELKKSAAVELSSLPEEKQDELIDQGRTSHKDIKAIKQTEKAFENISSTKEQEEVEKEAEVEAEAIPQEQPCDAAEELKGEAAAKNTTDLPIMKNKEQRKAFLESYHEWGVWYVDKHIGCTYYKYDFNNGARLIVETYRQPQTKWTDEHEQYFFHLVGGPEPPHGSYGIRKWTKHDRYCKHDNSETELIEFLKYIQRDSD